MALIEHAVKLVLRIAYNASNIENRMLNNGSDCA